MVSAQPTLPLFEPNDPDLAPLLDVDGPASGPHAARAAAFHRANPHVYRACVRIARRIRDRGVRHYGIKAVWEILRFSALETSGILYKLNNNYHAWYAREIMGREPDLVDFFETRCSPHDPDYRPDV
jgi:hypothetical protein